MGGGSSERRRWRTVLAVFAAVIVLASSVSAYAWFVYLPGWRPALREGERFGVDVSNHQGRIDWPTVAGDDITFAYVKATEGGDFVDAHFRENWDGARAAGLQVGAYHFFTLCRPGSEQAENFLRVVPRDADALPAALDLELGGNCGARPSTDEVVREVRAFVDRVEAELGRPVVLYALNAFVDEHRIHEAMPRAKWERSWIRRPDHEDWAIWQIGGFSRVRGIEGPTDLNVTRSLRPPGRLTGG